MAGVGGRGGMVKVVGVGWPRLHGQGGWGGVAEVRVKVARVGLPRWGCQGGWGGSVGACCCCCCCSWGGDGGFTFRSSLDCLSGDSEFGASSVSTTAPLVFSIEPFVVVVVVGDGDDVLVVVVVVVCSVSPLSAFVTCVTAFRFCFFVGDSFSFSSSLLLECDRFLSFSFSFFSLGVFVFFVFFFFFSPPEEDDDDDEEEDDDDDEEDSSSESLDELELELSSAFFGIVNV